MRGFSRGTNIVWRTRIIGALLGASIALPAAAFAPGQQSKVNGPPPATGLELVSEIDAYDGLASWVDMYNKGPWKYPERTAKRLAERETKTLFLQTSNYRKRSDICKPQAMSRLLEASHSHGMKVIAWYLPSYATPKRDWRRTKKAVVFESANGHRFDGFAMDIEATVERDIPTRNRRMIDLSDRLRDYVGDDYMLGAIIPDPVTQLFWPNFPYKKVNARYDVFLPMAYWTYRTSGPKRVYRYTRSALEIIRSRTDDPKVPVHVIGGIASDAPATEVRSFARAANKFEAVGASLYDFPITSGPQWDEMQRINR